MKISLIARYTAILSIIPSIFVFFFPGKIAGITMLCSFLLTISLIFYLMEFMPKIKIDGKLVIDLYIMSNLLILFRGFLDAESAEDWKVLISSTIVAMTFVPLSIYFGVYLSSIKEFFSTFLKIGIPLSLILLTKGDVVLGMMSFSKSVAPLYMLIIFTPYLSLKWNVLIFALGIISFYVDIDTRSNMINLIFAFLLSLTYYFRKVLSVIFIIKFLRSIFIIFPILFLYLGIYGDFNIFQLSDYTGAYQMDSKDGSSQDMVVDSRSSIYIDVLSQLEKDNAITWGLGGSGKTETSLTDIEYADFDVIYKEGRRGTESGMLNYAQYGGVIGVLIYFILFIKSSYLAIYKSENWFCIMLGLWVMYKGLFSFVEDRIFFSISSIFINISIGMCFNTSLRKMSNDEIKLFIKSIFEKKYDKDVVLINY